MEEARRLCMWGEEEEEHQESEEQAHVHMPLITTHKYEYQAYERRDYLRLESKNSRVLLEEPSSPRKCKHAGSKGRRQGPNRVKIVKAKCTYNRA